MCNKKNTQDIKRAFHNGCKIVNANLPTLGGFYGNTLGKHFACFIGENRWCEK